MSSYKIRAAEHALVSISEQILAIDSKRQKYADEIAQHSKQLAKIEASNPEYTEQLNEHRETMTAYWRVLMVVLVIGIDLALCSQGVEILCQKLGISSYWKYVVCCGLVFIEIGIAYTTLMKQREGGQQSWITLQLPYAIMVLLVGFAALVVVFEITGYDSITDGVSFVTFVIVTILVQATLLLASLMLHVWLIRNASEVAESFGFLKYKSDHSAKRRSIETLKKSSLDLDNQFRAETQRFVREYQTFKRYYPEEAYELIHTIPLSLKMKMEQEMGFPFTAKRRTQNTRSDE